MTNYFDYVLGEDLGTKDTRLFVAPRWTHLEKGQEVITDDGRHAKVIDHITLRDDEKETIEFLCTAAGTKRSELSMIMSKVEVHELDWSEYEEDEENE